MKIAGMVCMVAAALMGWSMNAEADGSLYDLSATRIDGLRATLGDFKGKVSLVVNTASECGYTPQYGQLQELYLRFKDRGFVVLGFPSNDFGGQEPGSEAEIQKFCSSKFGVSFPLFSKTKVLGETKDPVYRFLTSSTGGGEVGWNFEKFLVGRDGLVVNRYPSSAGPLSAELIKAIEAALKQ
jgi:glutathione peroxidase